MCGITGLFYFDNKKKVEEKLLHEMTDTLIHRGPDSKGVIVDNNIGLGFRRLSIIDLTSSGNQPMCNENKDIWMVLNGEIYNYKELTLSLIQKGHTFKSKTDTEVVIHAYEEYGTNCLEFLDGMFAFAIWDKKRNIFFVARDRFGIKPLVYTINKNYFAFGSEIKAILKIPNINKDIDNQAVWQYFSLMQVPAPYTIYKNIKKLLPANAMIIKSDGSCKTWQYWDVKLQENHSISLKQWKEQLINSFNSAMVRHLNADVPVGIFLSGGLDSSALVAAASKIYREPVKTFSISFPDYNGFDESIYQKEIAKQYNTEHYEIKGTSEMLDAAKTLVIGRDEPFAISSALTLYYVSKLASEHVKVVLSGDGGDELFAGYNRRYNKAFHLKKLSNTPNFIINSANTVINYLFNPEKDSSRIGNKLHYIANNLKQSQINNFDELYLSTFTFFNTKQKKQLLHPDITSQIRKDYSEHYYKIFQQGPRKGLNRMLNFDLKTSLADEMLTKTDLCTSLVSIEGRVPLLDKTFTDIAFQIPTKMKLHSKEGKIVLKETFAKLLPQRIINRPKAGFNLPMKYWMKNELFNDLLRHNDSIINKKYVEKLLKINNVGRRNLGNELFIIYQYLLWENIDKI